MNTALTPNEIPSNPRRRGPLGLRISGRPVKTTVSYRGLSHNEIPSDPDRFGRLEWLFAVKHHMVGALRDQLVNMGAHPADNAMLFEYAQSTIHDQEIEEHRLADTCMPNECAWVFAEEIIHEYGVIRRPPPVTPLGFALSHLRAETWSEGKL